MDVWNKSIVNGYFHKQIRILDDPHPNFITIKVIIIITIKVNIIIITVSQMSLCLFDVPSLTSPSLIFFAYQSARTLVANFHDDDDDDGLRHHRHQDYNGGYWKRHKCQSVPFVLLSIQILWYEWISEYICIKKIIRTNIQIYLYEIKRYKDVWGYKCCIRG